MAWNVKRERLFLSGRYFCHMFLLRLYMPHSQCRVGPWSRDLMCHSRPRRFFFCSALAGFVPSFARLVSPRLIWRAALPSRQESMNACTDPISTWTTPVRKGAHAKHKNMNLQESHSALFQAFSGRHFPERNCPASQTLLARFVGSKTRVALLSQILKE